MTNPSRGIAMHRRVVPAFPAFVVAIGLVLAGCGSSSKSAGSTTTQAATSTTAALSGSLTVSAAASLTGTFATLKANFEKAHPGTTISTNFGSSGTLETQIESGAPADEAAFADTATMQKLAGKGLLSAPAQVFARNRLVIVTKPGNPKGVKTLADLATVGTVAFCASTVPCGKYAGQILRKAGVAIPSSKVTLGQDVKATLNAVTTGDADAAIVYATDAQAAGSKVTAVAIPDAQNAVASYPIAVMKASNQPALAAAFEAYVLSAPGQAVLRKAGFLAP